MPAVLQLHGYLGKFGCGGNQQASQLRAWKRKSRLQTIFCWYCGMAATEFVPAALGAGPVWCPQCLDKHTEATFGRRPLALRLPAGLSQSDSNVRQPADRHGPARLPCLAVQRRG
jgi:hypothetical protein